jgi:CheY-like chemotaxis protein
MTILIVDDETEIRESLEEFLSDEGYAVDSAADGAGALEKLNKEKPPCVVILDLLMPLVSGNEVYDKMQEDPRLSKIPVIISTSDPSRAPTGSTVMKKPINLDRLLGAIRRYCH